MPTGHGKVAYALRRVMGEAAANVLLQNGQENKIYQFTGSELYSYQDVANELSLLSGKTVNYTDADATMFPDKLKELGVPEISIMIASGFSADIKNSQYEIVSNDLEKLLGRRPTSLKGSLKEIYSF
ncbi:MAG TPA: hypothetical protein VFX43_08050 [Chitinophagaceae bacterium]|nr:hypothetical protein [Chitinophagaceae bacterium]